MHTVLAMLTSFVDAMSLIPFVVWWAVHPYDRTLHMKHRNRVLIVEKQ